MWPAVPAPDVNELKQRLDVGFFTAGEQMDYQDRVYNFCDYVRKVQGISWLNALHDFDGDGECFETPLHYILHDTSDWRTIEFLVSLGADPNVRDSRGKPQLFCFFDGGIDWRWSTFRTLVDAGANLKATYAGKSFAQLAQTFSKESPNDKLYLYSMIWDVVKKELHISSDDEEGD